MHYPANKVEYKEYLKSDYWKNVRKQKIEKRIFKKDKGCQICSKKNVLFNIHHRRYNLKRKSLLFNEQKKYLMVLCADCHKSYHLIFGNKPLYEFRYARIINLIKSDKSPQEAMEIVKNKQYGKVIKATGGIVRELEIKTERKRMYCKKLEVKL